MTPLCTLLKQFEKEWTQESMEEEDQKQQQKTGDDLEAAAKIFVEAVGLLWNLLEACPIALEVFNRECCAGILLCSLAHSSLPLSVHLASLQCLVSATEDNKATAEAVAAERGLIEAVLTKDKTVSFDIFCFIASNKFNKRK